MKCVCPSGGNRTCPDDCLLAVWHNLSPAGQKARRKPLAEQLYKQGYTMEAIATQLGVNHSTIVRDLREFVHDAQIKKPAKTATNPKGAGRPKGKRSRRHRNPPELEGQAARLVLDEGKTRQQAATETGMGEHIVQRAVAREEGRREAELQIDRSELSMTAQEKLDSAIRQHKRKLDFEFEDRVRAESLKHIDEMILPQYLKEIDEARAIIKARKGVMPYTDFRKILACLHPDRVDKAQQVLYTEVFQLFKSYQIVLCKEAELPTLHMDMPRTYAEHMARKQAVSAKRRKQRSGSDNTPSRVL
jgi:transposase